MCALLVSEAKAILERRAAVVEDYCRQQLNAMAIPGRLRDSMLYSLMAGGKRLRPALCMSSAVMYGLAESQVLPFACAIEMIHTYSLIHDDLPAMDDDDLRRGKPSNHKQFDEATAILAGDGLLTDAFGVAAQTEAPPAALLAALVELSQAAGSSGMVGGQMLDMLYTGRGGVSLENVARMQAMKTGAMIRAACVCGALLAQASAAAVRNMGEYGASLGKAFQIADDILDIVGDSAVMGKPVGSDIAQGKITYPALMGVEQSRQLARAEAEQAMGHLPPDGPEADFLRAIALMCVERSA